MKKSIKVILAGLLVAPMMAMGISVYAPTMQPVSATPVGGILNGANSAKSTDQPADLFGTGGIFQIIVNTILYVLGAISVIMLVYGGVRYTTSGGNTANVTAAKNTIMYAIIGLIVALLAYAIVNFVLTNLITT